MGCNGVQWGGSGAAMGCNGAAMGCNGMAMGCSGVAMGQQWDAMGCSGVQWGGSGAAMGCNGAAMGCYGAAVGRSGAQWVLCCAVQRFDGDSEVSAAQSADTLAFVALLEEKLLPVWVSGGPSYSPHPIQPLQPL